MTSQTGYSCNMLFQSMNDDLNASMATADELSREFSSLLHEVTPTPPQHTHTQEVTTSPLQPGYEISSPSIQRDMPLSVVPSGSPTPSYSGSFSGSTSTSRISSPMDRKSSLPSSPRRKDTLLPSGGSQRSHSPLSSPQLRSVSPSPLPRYSASYNSSNYGQQNSPNQSPHLQRRHSPSRYDRSPHDTGPRASYTDRSSSPSQFGVPMASTLPRQPNVPVASPLPRQLNGPLSSTLPRNFGGLKQTEEAVQRQKNSGRWNETDLDAWFNKKPHHTYDRLPGGILWMTDPSQPNDEGITALHNAICGGHYNVVDFLVRIGANVSAPDSHGWCGGGNG
ncbi:hypothetical protein NHX12_009181, partial [Muraenolepis orangiensis]